MIILNAPFLKQVLLAVLCSLLFTGCSIEKRHYTGGYYVNFKNAKKKSEKPHHNISEDFTAITDESELKNIEFNDTVSTLPVVANGVICAKHYQAPDDDYFNQPDIIKKVEYITKHLPTLIKDKNKPEKTEERLAKDAVAMAIISILLFALFVAVCFWAAAIFTGELIVALIMSIIVVPIWIGSGIFVLIAAISAIALGQKLKGLHKGEPDYDTKAVSNFAFITGLLVLVGIAACIFFLIPALFA